jgi:site-specific recombinase XerC
LTEYAQTARLMRELERAALKNKAYRRFPVGQEVGRYLRHLRWSDAAANTLDTYEIALSRLAVDFADFETLDRFAAPDGAELVEEFLERHWGEAAPATRAGRLSAVKSFFQWAVDNGRLAFNPAAKIKAPRGRPRERQAYHRDLIHRLVTAQPGLREQIALQLLGRLALRKNELRLLRIGDFDMARNEVRVHGKGGKIVVLPFGALRDLVRDLELHIAGETRQPDEYLLYPKRDRLRSLDPASVHRWFKRFLEQAGLPATIEIHELRHSAADELWRITGDIVLAQLLRHESVATTQAYLHPRREDLLEGLRRVDEAWQVVPSEDPDAA